MRNLIMTLGAALLALTLIGYEMQLYSTAAEKSRLQTAAREAAAAACIYYEKSSGNAAFDAVKGVAEKAFVMNYKDSHETEICIEREDGTKGVITVKASRGEIRASGRYRYSYKGEK